LAAPLHAGPSDAKIKREKRPRSKVAPVPQQQTDGYASSGESPTVKPRHSPTPAAVAAAPSVAGPSALDDFASLDSSLTADPFAAPFSLDGARAASDVSALISPDSLSGMTIVPSRQSTLTTEAPLEELEDLAGGAEGTGDDSNRRKVRHNLTERRRVDRMNQLFNRLFMAIEDTAPAPAVTDRTSGAPVGLGVCGADGKPINPARWSKADVLEGALNVIQDLRKQLEEERLARTLGVPMAGDHPPSSNGGDDSYSQSDSLSEAGANEFRYHEAAVLAMPQGMAPAASMAFTGALLQPISNVPSLGMGLISPVDASPRLN